MKKLYFLLFAFMFTSCEKETDCCTVVDRNLDIKYSNASGGSWLKQQGLSERDINVYFIKEGQKEKVFRGNLDYPKMFFIYQDASGKDILRLFPSDYIENNKSQTLIEFSPTNVDTVVTLFKAGSSSSTSQEVWYNGKSVWNINQRSAREIEIIKE